MTDLTAGAGTEHRSSPQQIRWAPFCWAIGILLVLVGITAAERIFAPPRDAGAISLLERVHLGPDVESGFPIFAGYVAPQDWFWADPEERTTVVSPSGDTTISVELIGEVADPPAWLRTQLAVGELQAPIDAAETDGGLRRYAVVEDVTVGQHRLLVAVCTPGAPAHCVSVIAEGPDGVSQNPTVHGVIESVEIS